MSTSQIRNDGKYRYLPPRLPPYVQDALLGNVGHRGVDGNDHVGGVGLYASCYTTLAEELAVEIHESAVGGGVR